MDGEDEGEIALPEAGAQGVPVEEINPDLQAYFSRVDEKMLRSPANVNPEEVARTPQHSSSLFQIRQRLLGFACRMWLAGMLVAGSVCHSSFTVHSREGLHRGGSPEAEAGFRWATPKPLLEAGAVDPDQNVRLSYERHLVLERRSLLISRVINQTIITLADV